jgi:hypothetical protein
MRRSGAWPGKVWLDDVEVAGDSCAVSVNGEIGDSLTAYYNEHDPFAEPGSSPLATGITNRVGKLRGYGNALTAPVAQGFIEAYIEAEKALEEAL